MNTKEMKKEELLKENYLKIKKVKYEEFLKYVDDEPVYVEKEFIGGVLHYPRNLKFYSEISFLTIEGVEKAIDLQFLINIEDFEEKIDEKQIELLEEIFEDKKREDGVKNELIKKINELEDVGRSCEEERIEKIGKMKKQFKDSTNLLNRRDAMKKVSENLEKDLEESKYNSIVRNERVNMTNLIDLSIIHIPIKTVKYANEEDFNGLVYREYDGSLIGLGDEEKLKKLTEEILEKKGVKREEILRLNEFNGYEDDNIRIRFDYLIEDIGKETSLTMEIVIKYKKDFYKEEEVENIKKMIEKTIS